MPKKTARNYDEDYRARIPATLLPPLTKLAQKGSRKVPQEVILAVSNHIKRSGK